MCGCVLQNSSQDILLIFEIIVKTTNAIFKKIFVTRYFGFCENFLICTKEETAQENALPGATRNT